MSGNDQTQPASKEHAFLCVVDDSEEFGNALRFACGRANSVGARIALLYVAQPAEFQHWMDVGERMREEAREEAEEMLRVVANLAEKHTGKKPICYIREGRIRDEVVSLINEQQDISLIVLGAATGTDGPGPLVSHLVEEMSGTLRVPLTVVPGGLTEEEIDAVV